MDQESSTYIYTRPCVKQTAGGRLLNGARSSAQGPVTTYRGKMGVGGGMRLRRDRIYVYV